MIVMFVYFFFGIDTKSGVFLIGQQASGCFYNVFAFFRCLFHLSSQKQATTSSYVAWKLRKRMEHVKSVKINHTCCCGVIAKVHFGTRVYYKSGTFKQNIEFKVISLFNIIIYQIIMLFRNDCILLTFFAISAFCFII